jgi:hypothetical protein
LVLGLRVWQDENATVPADFSNAVLTAQVRVTPDASDVAAEFDIEVSGNMLTLTLEPKRTRDLGPTNVFDVECDWDGTDTNVQTLLAGSLNVAADVTRSATV